LKPVNSFLYVGSGYSSDLMCGIYNDMNSEFFWMYCRIYWCVLWM